MQQHCQLELEASKPKFKGGDPRFPGFILVSTVPSLYVPLTLQLIMSRSVPDLNSMHLSLQQSLNMSSWSTFMVRAITPCVSFLSCLSIVHLQGRPLTAHLNVVKLAFQMFYSITMGSYTLISVQGKASSERIKFVIKELRCKSCPLTLLSLPLSLFAPCAPTPTRYVVPT